MWALPSALLLAAAVIGLSPTTRAPARQARLPAGGSVTPAAGSRAPIKTAAAGGRVAARKLGGGGPLAAARAFLYSYLEVSYGQASPRALRGASANLRAGFERNPPHVIAPVTGREARVVKLRVQAAAPGRSVAVATVSDGESEYAVMLRLVRNPRGWLVTGVGPS